MIVTRICLKLKFLALPRLPIDTLLSEYFALNWHRVIDWGVRNFPVHRGAHRSNEKLVSHEKAPIVSYIFICVFGMRRVSGYLCWPIESRHYSSHRERKAARPGSQSLGALGNAATHCVIHQHRPLSIIQKRTRGKLCARTSCTRTEPIAVCSTRRHFARVVT